jgi:hypothetical protein
VEQSKPKVTNPAPFADSTNYNEKQPEYYKRCKDNMNDKDNISKKSGVFWLDHFLHHRIAYQLQLF